MVEPNLQSIADRFGAGGVVHSISDTTTDSAHHAADGARDTTYCGTDLQIGGQQRKR